ncbi:MAG TPA: hypothetical protein VE912_05465, partial [Bacteroidales bacterium]|nr:hypothetical protein [Bacteroidales bacterium]
KDQIAKIDQLLATRQQAAAQAAQKESDYSKAVSTGDNMFKLEEYAASKAAYQQALSIKPDEAYPENQIAKIDQLVKSRQQAAAATAQKEQEYKETVSGADKQFDNADYEAAQELYKKALTLKPDEIYPKQRLARIKEIREMLASNETTAKQKKLQEEQQAGKKIPLKDLKSMDDTELDMYLKKLSKSYPEGISHEIYSVGNDEIHRYIIIRNGEIKEFRMIRHGWGGIDYSLNDKPVTALYFNQQIKKRDEEYYKTIKK